MGIKDLITVGEIRVEPIPFVEIDRLELVSHINSHTYLTVQGNVSDTEKENLDELAVTGAEITVKGLDGTVLFCGILTKIEMKEQGNVLTVSIHSCSYTILLDREKRNRPFQEINRTVGELIRLAAKRTPQAGMLIDEACEKPIGQFMMQYGETDWEFIKRLASHCGQSVYPDNQTTYPAFYVGKLKPFNVLEIDQGAPCIYCRTSGDDGSYSAFYRLYLDSEWLNLGDCVSFEGMKLYVKSVHTKLEHSVLRNCYKLSFKDKMEIEKIYNTKLGGKSVTGTVTKIKRDRVCVSIPSDDNDGEEETCWFLYSTVYASGDGSGWYCMPEQGDKVRVQFPDEDEKNAYAISSVSEYRPTGNSSDRMGDYTRRYIRNRQGMQVMWTPDRVLISSNGACLVDINQNGTLSISAESKIVIHSGQDVEIVAGNQILLNGGGGIHIQCGAKAEIDMGNDGILALKGNEVFTN